MLASSYFRIFLLGTLSSVLRVWSQNVTTTTKAANDEQTPSEQWPYLFYYLTAAFFAVFSPSEMLAPSYFRIFLLGTFSLVLRVWSQNVTTTTSTTTTKAAKDERTPSSSEQWPYLFYYLTAAFFAVSFYAVMAVITYRTVRETRKHQMIEALKMRARKTVVEQKGD
uniref:Endoplasmic reticulum transmembrane protein n=1 Tax=Steinernema glaseri TaxID=37863 RepID=A0A1I7ZAD7_9BILA